MLILILIISIAIIILIHELGHFLTAKFFGVKVEEFGIGFPPRLFSKKFGETRYSFNVLPFGGFVRLLGESGVEDDIDPEDKGRSLLAQSVWRRTVIIVAGVVMNFILGWFILSGVYMVGSEQQLIVTQIEVGSPAAVAGLELNDKFADFISADNFIAFVNDNKGSETTFEVIRSNNGIKERLSLTGTPRAEVPPGKGALGVGISEVGIEQLPFFESLWRGLKQSVFIIGAIFQALGGLISDLFSGGGVDDGFVGPVGIYNIANETSRLGALHFLQLMAVISLNFTVLNILPIPALDGGRLLFIIFEKIKGSPIRQRRENISHAIGFIVLILLMIAITIRDIVGLL